MAKLCRFCNGVLQLKRMLWYGQVEERYKCSDCGMVF